MTPTPGDDIAVDEKTAVERAAAVRVDTVAATAGVTDQRLTLTA